MKIIFSECTKIKDRYDVEIRKRLVRAAIETVSGKPPKICFNWPEFTIETEDDDIIVITYDTLRKIKKTLGAKSTTITG